MKRLPAFAAAWKVRPSVSSKGLQRRRSRPVLEVLERREVLSTFTWNGATGDANWGTDGNWAGGTAPTTGPADITFPNTSTAQTITFPTAYPALSITSLKVQGGSYTLVGSKGGTPTPITIADQAPIQVDTGATLTISGALGGPLANSLLMQYAGTANETGVGTLVLNNEISQYAAGSGLQTFHIGSGAHVVIGGSNGMDRTLFQVDTGANLAVTEGRIPTFGSLSGNGTLTIGVNPGKTSSTGLILSPPAGTSNTFSGDITGQGGIFP